MKNTKKKKKLSYLIPLPRQSPRLADQKAFFKALKRLDNVAQGENRLDSLRDTLNTIRKDHKNRKRITRTSPTIAAKYIALAQALYQARRISKPTFIHFSVSQVHNVHDDRWLNGEYNNELAPISNAMDTIKKENGLNPDEDWLLGEGPKEYDNLNKKYGDILDRKLLDTLREFGLNDLADIKEQTPTKYNRLWERGRRSIFHSDEHIQAVRDIIIRYEEDARKAAGTQAYTAAIIALGASVEGLLLIRCLRSKHKACHIANKLKNINKKHINDPTRWKFETLIEVCLNANWLPAIETGVARYNTARLAHILRDMRNYVHPGKQARQNPWNEVEERDYKDAEAIYIVMRRTIGRISWRKGLIIKSEHQGAERSMRC